MSINNESSFDNGNYSSNDASDDGKVHGIDDHEQSGNEDAGPSDASKLKRYRWRHEENVQVCKSWLRISEQAIHGNSMKAEPERNAKAFKNHWGNISAAVSKYCGCVAAIQRRNKSGNAAADELGDAFNLFQTKYRIHFAFYDCFLVLRSSPKWNDEMARRDAKIVRKQAVKAGNKRTITASCAPGSSAATEVGTSTVIAEDEDGESVGSIIARPKGRKKSKNHASMDKKITDSLANWEANQQQLADKYAVLMKKIDMANAIKQEKLAVNKKLLAVNQGMLYEKLFSVDLEKLKNDEKTLRFYKLSRKQALDRMEAEVENEILRAEDLNGEQ
ncbi:hypothetical protein INT47_006791 [Mucor saturninus]|uniref:No apical meristem-associated C-terminal domain-containing protein n=1 Tax=Mucor saturninus TaxID=64648 RepID=A0A8H7QZ15_9FUNG|nr:hypothetical protein INT47_006791 [Mucor saturninus]